MMWYHMTCYKLLLLTPMIYYDLCRTIYDTV